MGESGEVLSIDGQLSGLENFGTSWSCRPDLTTRMVRIFSHLEWIESKTGLSSPARK